MNTNREASIKAFVVPRSMRPRFGSIGFKKGMLKKRKSIRTRIMLNSVLILLVLALATSYTAIAAFDLAKSVELLFKNSADMENLRSTLRQTQQSLEGYLMAKNSESLKDFIASSTRLSSIAGRLNRANKTDDIFLLEKNLAFLVEDYLESAEGAVQAKRGRDVPTYVALHDAARHSAEQIEYLSAQIDTIQLGSSLGAFSIYRTNIGLALISNLVLLAAAFLFSMALIARYSYTITEPLSRLAVAAQAVGRGEYDHPLPPYETEDEIGTLHDAFIAMRTSVKSAFEELTRKAELERTLMEERMRNLTFQHRLKDAELLALQTQINPHFLYNTLAAGWQLALAQGDEKTAEFLEKLAAFIRYVLKPSTRSVLVSEEIECVRQYLWLLRLRFGDRYRFRLEISDEALGYETPALLLQPLVENAIVHGLRDIEQGGDVIISARLDGGMLKLSVSDSGKGMQEEDIARALAAADPDDATPQRGIGLHNVVRRVALATNGKGKVDIATEPGHGTRITILLPAGMENPVQIEDTQIENKEGEKERDKA